MNRIVIISAALLLLLPGCKEKDEELQLEEITIDFQVSNIETYYDRLQLHLIINVENGNPPYSFNWIKPDTLSGPGPFNLILKSDLDIILLVKDSQGNSKTETFQLRISDYLNDTTLDYRNKFVGTFNFNTTLLSYNPINTDTGWILIIDTSYIQHTGTINKYLSDRILIKYSDGTPWAGCNSSNAGISCQGYLESDCVQGCYPPWVVYITNWISPAIIGVDSLQLVIGSSWLNGSGLITEDSVYFKKQWSGQLGGGSTTIIGKRVN